MKERIFISYKRADYEQVKKLVRLIENRTGIKCWIDLEGIESSAQFASKICDAIDDYFRGYIDTNGELIFAFDPEWDQVSDFSDGYAWANNGGEKGAVYKEWKFNKLGKVVRTIIYDDYNKIEILNDNNKLYRTIHYEDTCVIIKDNRGRIIERVSKDTFDIKNI